LILSLYFKILFIIVLFFISFPFILLHS
jgi:hypothetical protein